MKKNLCSGGHFAFQNISNLFCTILGLPFILISQFCIILIRFRSIIDLSLCNYVNFIPDWSYQLFHSYYSVLQNIPFSNVYIHTIFCRNKHAFKYSCPLNFMIRLLQTFYYVSISETRKHKRKTGKKNYSNAA